MRYELIDYQREAALDVVKRLRLGRGLGRTAMRSSFALSAITGSGKTVIATAVIEALLFGRPTSGRGRPEGDVPVDHGRPGLTARPATGCSTPRTAPAQDPD